MSRTRQRIAVLIIITLLAPIVFSLFPGVGALTAKEVAAESAKAKLNLAKYEIGVNSSPEYITLDNYNGAATYTYKSEDEKIATVSEYGMLRGVAYGSTKINITENVDGVATNLGYVTVNVREPYLDKEMKAGLNSYSYITINCNNRDAAYAYESSDNKVVKLDKFGGLYGVKLGSATINVTQKYKGKITKLGSIKVTVVNSELTDKEIEVPVSEYAGYYIYFNYFNEKAKYTYKSDNSEIAKVDQYGAVTGVKLGTTKVTVSETYNKKTIKLGTIDVKVVGASLNKDYSTVDLGINSSNTLTSSIYIYYLDESAYYYAVSANSSIVVAENVDEYGYRYCKLNAVGLGKTKLTIYEEKDKKKRKLGVVTVTVKEIPIQSLDIYSGYAEEIDGIPTITVDFYRDYVSGYMREMLDVRPYNATTPITYSSSDEKVIQIDSSGNFTTISAGSATLTATCGKYSTSLKVIVKAVPATSISFNDYYFGYDNDTKRLSKTYYLGDDFSYYSLKNYMIIEPYNATDSITFTSSDESVIKVDENGGITPVAEGSAVITAKCGKLSTSLSVYVYEGFK